MIKISAKAEYAARAILQLSMGWEKSKPIQLADIAKNQSIPREFLVQVMAALNKGGVVTSRRGANGGYMLSREPKAISLRQIVETIDGKVSEFRCGDHSFSQCRNDPDCVFHQIWVEIIEVTSQKLDKVSFADLCQDLKKKGTTRPPCAVPR